MKTTILKISLWSLAIITACGTCHATDFFTQARKQLGDGRGGPQAKIGGTLGQFGDGRGGPKGWGEQIGDGKGGPHGWGYQIGNGKGGAKWGPWQIHPPLPPFPASPKPNQGSYRAMDNRTLKAYVEGYNADDLKQAIQTMDTKTAKRALGVVDMSTFKRACHVMDQGSFAALLRTVSPETHHRMLQYRN